MNLRTTGPAFVVAALFSACAAPAAPQSVVGRVATETFDAPVQSVVAAQGNAIIATAPVGSDGSFALSIPPGAHYRIVVLTTSGQPTLVFPRPGGAIDATFDVLGATAPFDLGVVRHVGNPSARTYEFGVSPIAPTLGLASDHTGGGALHVRLAEGDSSDGSDDQCEDGIDPTTGAVCVDDNEDGGECDGGDNGDDGGDDNCENGIDPATGAECDGGPSANPDDGSDDSSDDGETEDGETPSDAAVADHNLPPSIGCDGGDEGDDDGEHDDGE